MKLNFQFGHNFSLSQLELDSVLGKSHSSDGDLKGLLRGGAGNQVREEIVDFNHLNSVCNRLGGLVSVSDQKGKVLWRHSAKSWFRRDRLKPYADSRKGMIPPKLARIMINLALRNKVSQGLTLLDPFCGTGTILIEAGILGLNTIGSDLDPIQLQGTRRNLNWARSHNFELLESDATHISEKINTSVDFIVTEPFMGTPTPRPEKIKDIVTGLKKLYLGCFKDWIKILKPGGVVVITLPYFELNGKTVKTSSVIDSIHPVGYNVKTKDLNFTRPGSIVQREIIVLEKINIRH
jgi:tRNA G10  N-methylase Trm11